MNTVGLHPLPTPPDKRVRTRRSDEAEQVPPRSSLNAAEQEADRTVSAVLRLIALIEPVNPSTFHPLFSHRRWSSQKLAKIIIAYILDRFFPMEPSKSSATRPSMLIAGKKSTGKAGTAMPCARRTAINLFLLATMPTDRMPWLASPAVTAVA